jgi:D-serine deaminase-like pyridoxal phosphate-dependent protein
MKMEQIPTPALILKKSTYEKNAEYMDALLQKSTMKLRPHYKSHKCAAIAHE